MPERKGGQAEKNMKKKTALFVLIAAIVCCGCTENLKSVDVIMEQGSFQEEDIVEKSLPPAREVKSISGGNYAYECLDEAEKRAYDQILDCLLNQEEKVTVETDSPEKLAEIYASVLADYGEIFWNSGYVYTLYTQGETVVGMEFAPKYTKSREERRKLQFEIDQVVDEIVQGINADATDYEKTKYVYDYLTTNVEYSVESEENQNIISVFLNGSTVCQGYSCATQYLLKKLGISSTILNGTANGEAHAWNLVRMEGEYYYLDTTWGNANYQKEDTAGTFPNYGYFAITTEEMQKTHTPDVPFPLPECVATAQNYYVKEGRYFSEAKTEEIGAILKAEYEGEKETVSFKFATKEQYDSVKTYFIDEQHIADYCQGISSVYYIEEKDLNILTIKLKK